jgi:hypothetical protein
MLSSMSELLLDALLRCCGSHGIGAERAGGLVRAQDGLTLEPRVSTREPPAGSAQVQVQVDFAVQSPRMGAVPFLDSFGGLGATREAAELNALQKFVQGSFHVIVESLTTHSCPPGDGEADAVEWEDWVGESGAAWRVCTGPLLILATREGARIDGFGEFFPALTDLFRARVSPGPHWMRLFLGAIDGGHVGSEVLVDGGVWADGQRLLDSHPWTYPQGYASLRHLLIALPKGG